MTTWQDRLAAAVARFDNLSDAELIARYIEARDESEEINSAMVARLKATALAKAPVGSIWRVVADGGEFAGRMVKVEAPVAMGGPFAPDKRFGAGVSVRLGRKHSPSGDGWGLRRQNVHIARLGKRQE